MLSEAKAITKLEECAAKFNAAVNRKDWGVAHNLYMEAVIVTSFMEIRGDVRKRLYGDWDSDDGTDTDTALDNGLFSRKDLERVNRECCIMRNMAYEDMALRREGEPLRYYGESDFCARCRDKKRAARRWDDSGLG